MGIISIIPTENTVAYAVVGDPALPPSHTTINIKGDSNFVAGHNLEISDSNVQTAQHVPKELEKELADLLDDIKNANSPKPVQESKVKKFLEKVAASSTSSVVASIAVSIFKAAIGLP